MKNINIVLNGNGTHLEIDTDAAMLMTFDECPEDEDTIRSQITFGGTVNPLAVTEQMAAAMVNLLTVIGDHKIAKSMIRDCLEDNPNAPNNIYSLFLTEFAEELKRIGLVGEDGSIGNENSNRKPD